MTFTWSGLIAILAHEALTSGQAITAPTIVYKDGISFKFNPFQIGAST